MLVIILTKLLLKGAIKTFIVKPILSATMTFIPQHTIANATLLGHEIAFSSSDLLKFGIEKLHERFVEKQLDFQVNKLSKYIYGVSPASELALLFNKEYYDEEELIVDLTKFEEYIDALVKPLMVPENGVEQDRFEENAVLIKVMQDLDLAINRSTNHMFDHAHDEEKLVEEILEKNARTIEEQRKPLPRVPLGKKTQQQEEEEIDAILNKFSNQ